MTRAQYRALQQEQRRLKAEHEAALVGLTYADWHDMTPGAATAQSLYERLQAVNHRLEVVESRDMEFSEDWADMAREGNGF